MSVYDWEEDRYEDERYDDEPDPDRKVVCRICGEERFWDDCDVPAWHRTNTTIGPPDVRLACERCDRIHVSVTHCEWCLDEYQRTGDATDPLACYRCDPEMFGTGNPENDNPVRALAALIEELRDD